MFDLFNVTILYMCKDFGLIIRNGDGNKKKYCKNFILKFKFKKETAPRTIAMLPFSLRSKTAGFFPDEMGDYL